MTYDMPTAYVNRMDILFITDGDPCGELPAEFKAKYKATKEEKGFKAQGIIIDGHTTKYLNEFCDTVTNIKDLDEDGELTNIFKAIKDNDN